MTRFLFFILSVLFVGSAAADGIINYADANVKAICVANWDTDGDGELSYDEAAAVTDLGQVFAYHSDIVSFDELQYFTGLKSIGYDAFYNCSLRSITIPKSVTSIGDWAFEACYNLTSITIPESVTSIGYNAFYGCSNLESIVVNPDNPVFDSRDNCNAIVESASNTLILGFQNTIIPNTVTSIGDYAFEYCYNLTSITIPESVTTIGDWAFENCNNLTSVTIPESVTSIGYGAFAYCNNLVSIDVDTDNPIYDSRDNCNAIIESASNTLILGCQNTIIPNSVTSIYDYAFYGCYNLTSITIPEGVTSIGYGAFRGCNNLTSITIPASVTSIGNYAFSGCSNFNSIVVDTDNPVYDSRDNCNAIIETTSNTLLYGCQNTIIPNTVTSVGDRAFYNCYNLTSITIPESVTSIGYGAFQYCNSLTSVTIPASVTSIGNYAFFNSYNLTSVIIHEGVTSIGYEAFAYCYNLSSITIPASVTSIGAWAFEYCNRLSEITSYIEEPFEISDNVFYGIQNLTLYVPDGCKEKYESTAGWNIFQTIVEGEVPIIDFADATVKAICVENWDSNRDGELSYGEAAAVTDLGRVFRYHSDIVSFDELQYFTGLTSIGNSAFYNCSLTSITIPKSVTSIGNYAFEYCYNLTSITIPESVTGIGYGAFAYCNNLVSIDVDTDNPIYDSRDNCNAIIETASNTLILGCQNTIIPNTVTSIGDYAFRYCYNLTSITIPEGVTSIGYEAFSNCSLTSITIPESVTSIGAWAFEHCYNLTSITIPKNVTYIGYGAFSGCNNLVSIVVDTDNRVYDSRDNCNAIIETDNNTLILGCQNTIIPNSVTSIYDYAFLDCDNLTSITIPVSVTSIGYDAFEYCENLTSITIPVSVRSICDYAFYGCSGLNEITSLIVNPFEISEYVFPTNQDITLYVLPSSKQKYETTSAWNLFTNIVEIDPADVEDVDMTILLKNPYFEEGENGWTVEAAYGSGAYGREGNVRPGGSASNMCYEAWNNSSFDIYQVIENAPVGVYEIEVQGFYRYLRDWDAWNAYQTQESSYVKKDGAPVYVYMNNNASPFVNVFDEPKEYGVLYTNSVDNDTYADPDYEYWYPNQMNSSAEAFSAGMYKQSAFGLVAREGDVLRIGVKGSSNQGNDSWVIWDNFKLIYRSFYPEVIRPVLENAMADANDYLGLLMGKTEYAALTTALAEAEQVISGNNGEEMFNALNALYDAKNLARISKDIFLQEEVAADTLRLSEAISSIENEKLSQATLKDAKTLLTAIAENTRYENEDVYLLYYDVTEMIDRLYYSADLYDQLFDVAMYGYETCYNVGEDTRKGLENEIGKTQDLVDLSLYYYEDGAFTDNEAEDMIYYLREETDNLSNLIINYIDATEWQILKTVYEQRAEQETWKIVWNFDTDRPWKSNVPGVETYDGHVTELSLSSNNMIGDVPLDLLDLPRLQKLDLSSNHLTTLETVIPAQVTDLSLGNQTMDYKANLTLKDMLSGNIMSQIPNILFYDHSNQSFDARLYLRCSNQSDNWWMDLYSDNEGRLSIDYMSSNYCDDNGATLNVESQYDGSTFSVCFTFDEGDANIDGEVDVLDLQTIINYIFLRNNSRLFNMTAADLWKDQKINVQDVVKLVDLLMALEDDGEPVAGARHSSPPTAEASIYIVNGQLVINSNKPVAAFDVTVNGVNGFRLSEQLKQLGITCRIDTKPTGFHMIGYSLSGGKLPAGETILGTTGSIDPVIVRALLADDEAQTISIGTNSGYATGIESQFDINEQEDAYDLQGRKISPQRQATMGKRSSVIIKNGHKIVK